MHTSQAPAGRALCEGGKRLGSAGQRCASWSPSCRHVYTGSTCFWLESSFHVCAPLQGEMLLNQDNEQLCQCCWFHGKSTLSVWWLFPWKSTSSVALLAILRLTLALTPAFTRDFEIEFVKVEKAPLKQTTSTNSQPSGQALYLGRVTLLADVQQLREVMSTPRSDTQSDKLKPKPMSTCITYIPKANKQGKEWTAVRHQTSFPDESIWASTESHHCAALASANYNHTSSSPP